MNGKPISPVLLPLLQKLPVEETGELEFKDARGGLPKDIWTTVSAFANTRGGWIILGVKEQQGTFVPVGLPNAQRLLKEFNDTVRSKTKISYAPCSPTDSFIETINGLYLIVIRVPAAPRRHRPVYINGNPYGAINKDKETGSYLRGSSGDYLCSKQEVDRMMREAAETAADATIVPYLTWDDLDARTFARYRRLYLTVNPTSPWNSYDDQRFLKAIGGYGDDKENNVEGITVAGLLLAGTPEAIRQWRTRHLIDFRLVSAGLDANRWEDRVAWEGNLFAAFEAIYPKLIADQPIPFQLRGSTRIDESPAHVALREALVNLLVHTDYSETRASIIIRSEKGYLFRNPGSSCIPKQDLLTGDRSDPRNPELIRMFRMVGLAEEAGTGISSIFKAWSALGFLAPAIEDDVERYEFSIGLRYSHLFSDKDRVWLHSLGGSWTEAEQLALVLARHEGDVDNAKLRKITGQHPADVSKVLGHLSSRGLLQISGHGRSVRYHLAPAAIGGLLSGQQSLPLNGNGKELNSPRMEPNPLDMEQSLQDKDKSLQGNEPNLPAIPTPEDKVWLVLQGMAKEARTNPRLNPAMSAEIIFRLCSAQPLSIYQIAQLIGRNAVYTGELIRPLIKSGRLLYEYPNAPSHPKQRYIAKQE